MKFRMRRAAWRKIYATKQRYVVADRHRFNPLKHTVFHRFEDDTEEVIELENGLSWTRWYVTRYLDGEMFRAFLTPGAIYAILRTVRQIPGVIQFKLDKEGYGYADTRWYCYAVEVDDSIDTSLSKNPDTDTRCIGTIVENYSRGSDDQERIAYCEET